MNWAWLKKIWADMKFCKLGQDIKKKDEPKMDGNCSNLLIDWRAKWSFTPSWLKLRGRFREASRPLPLPLLPYFSPLFPLALSYSHSRLSHSTARNCMMQSFSHLVFFSKPVRNRVYFAVSKFHSDPTVRSFCTEETLICVQKRKEGERLLSEFLGFPAISAMVA